MLPSEEECRLRPRSPGLGSAFVHSELSKRYISCEAERKPAACENFAPTERGGLLQWQACSLVHEIGSVVNATEAGGIKPSLLGSEGEGTCCELRWAR